MADPPVALTATASSGLAVTYSTASSACSVAGGIVTLLTTGSCAIKASQAGNGDYSAAPDVTRSFDISQAPQTITFPPITDHTLGEPPFNVIASSTSGLPVTFSGGGPGCSVAGSTVSVVGLGPCTVTARQPGTTTYLPAADVSRTFSVIGVPPAIPAPAPSGGVVGAAYSHAFTSFAGVPVAAFTVAGTLPPGLTLSTTGILSGTPTAAGTFTYTVTASNPVATPSATFTQTIAPPTVAIANASAVEGGGAVLFPVAFTSGVPSSPVTVSLALLAFPGDSATIGVDLPNSLPITHTWHPGEPTSFTIAVPITDDHVVEGNEQFHVFITAPGVDVGAGGAVGTVVDDDVALSGLSVGDASTLEGNGGTSALMFPITLSAPAPAGGLVVGFATGTGTATAGVDYTHASGSITIPAGATSAAIAVTVFGDVTPEPDETLTLTLSAAAPITRATATGTIVNDDGTSGPSLTVIGGSVVEPRRAGARKALPFTIVLSGPQPGPTTVSYATTTAGTATPVLDFVVSSGTITIPAGVTTVTITAVKAIGDRVTEGPETVGLSAGGAVGFATIVDRPPAGPRSGIS